MLASVMLTHLGKDEVSYYLSLTQGFQINNACKQCIHTIDIRNNRTKRYAHYTSPGSFATLDLLRTTTKVFANLCVSLSCIGSFPCGPENVFGKNRCYSRSNANRKWCNRLYTFLSVCYSRSFFFVLWQMFFVALAVPSYIICLRGLENYQEIAFTS